MDKSPDAFRTISEVADWLGIQAHVLRFWESKFTQVKPVKRAGGRRYYRPADMLLLGGIKKLLHEDGMTIKGVQKVLREQGVATVSELSQSLDDMAVNGARPRRAQTVVPFHDRPSVLETAQKARETAQVEMALSGEDDVIDTAPLPDEPLTEYPAPDASFDTDHVPEDEPELPEAEDVPEEPVVTFRRHASPPEEPPVAAEPEVEPEPEEEPEAEPLMAGTVAETVEAALPDPAEFAPEEPDADIEVPVTEALSEEGDSLDVAEIEPIEATEEPLDAVSEDFSTEISVEDPEAEEPLDVAMDMAAEEVEEPEVAEAPEEVEAPEAVEEDLSMDAPETLSEDAPADEPEPLDEPDLMADADIDDDVEDAYGENADIEDDAEPEETPVAERRPRVIDAPDPPAEELIDAPPGLLSLVASFDRLPSGQIGDIAPLAEALRAWQTGQKTRHAAQ